MVALGYDARRQWRAAPLVLVVPPGYLAHVLTKFMGLTQGEPAAGGDT